MVKFLLIRLSSIGDIVLTTPVIRCLKQQVEGAEVHFLVKKQFAQVLANNPYIDKIHSFDNSLPATIEALRCEQFDYIIDLHSNLRSFIIKRRLGVMAFTFRKLNFRKWLYTQLKINFLPKLHIVDRYLDTVHIFDVHNDGEGLDFFTDAETAGALRELPEGFGRGYIALVTGAKHVTKQMPVEKLAELCTLLPLPIVLLGGKDDTPVAERILAGSQSAIFNACGKFTLSGSAEIVRHARLVITHDTGLMHIASAFHKPIISLWGNTVPAFGMYPYMPGEGSRIMEIEGLPCRPCSKIGYKACPKKHFRCMTLQKPADIALEANRILSLMREY